MTSRKKSYHPVDEVTTHLAASLDRLNAGDLAITTKVVLSVDVTSKSDGRRGRLGNAMFLRR